MKLTRYTDYALRVMIQLATVSDRLVSIAEIATIYGISQNHLMKIVQDLGQAGFVETLRGRGGGLRLARPAERISLADLIRHTEGDNALISCDGCVISPACGLPPVLARAMDAFYAELGQYTLADIARQRDVLHSRFLRPAPDAGPPQKAARKQACAQIESTDQ